MATLVLTAVGTALGGPVGGALGALAGQAIDNAVLRPEGREGPRLADLAVQTSSYGTPIPLLFGRMRVAGTIIWSTDLIEQVARGGGGKGRGSATTYSYSASFAVALSGRPIRSVGRIWADGTLLRGAAGDVKVPGRFRLHVGSEDQAADPMIAAAEGTGRAPAHRGIAYAVFEDLALADFGNRIPSLTFEVVADDGPVTCGAIVAAITGDAIAAGEATLPLIGYAAHGDSRRRVAETLGDAGGAWIVERDGALALASGHGAAGAGATVMVDDRGMGGAGTGRRRIAPADTAPRSATVQHYDPARDYQTGLQVATRPDAGMRTLRIDLPAVIDADAARTIAQDALTRADLMRERRVVTLDWRAIGLAPGERVRIAGEAGLWRIAGWSLEGMALQLELARVARQPAAARGTPGRVLPAPDRPAGTTIVHAFEIPPLDDAVLSAPRLTIAAAGTEAGWRQAALSTSIDGGGWTPVGTRRLPAVVGTVASPVPAASSRLIDRRTTIEVTLAHADMLLGDADGAAIDGGANRALVGDEIVQFERAEPVGAARWRLSGLWRGRRGTEWAAGAAAAGARFVLLDPEALHVVDLPASAVGGVVRVLAAGVGDGADGVTVSAAIDGASIAPPAPVHLAIARRDGAERLVWTRRSRAGWQWRDGVDAPLVEEAERYRVTHVRGDGTAVDTEHDAAIAPIDPAGRRWSVRQAGTHASSRAASLTSDR